MGDCAVFYDEIRVSVRDPERLEIWVYIRGQGDCPFQALGWHYQAFPASVTTQDFLNQWAKGDHDPLMWPRQNPPETVPNFEPPSLDQIEAAIRGRE